MIEDFPLCQSYTYLNTARYGAQPKSVIDQEKAFLDHVARHGSWEFDHWSDRYEDTRASCGQLMGVNTSDVFFLPSVSTGFNMAAQYLPKRKVLCFNDDFPSVRMVWEPHGYGVTYLSYREADFATKWQEALLEKNLIVSVSWVQSADGFTIDLDQLYTICKCQGHLLVLDVTQGLGAMPFRIDPDVSALVLCAGFKWLLAGYGIAIGYLSEDLQALFKPQRGWNSLGAEGLLKTGAPSLESGNATYLNAAGLGAGIEYLQQVGVEQISQHNLELKQQLVKELLKRGYVIKDPTNPSGIVTFQTDQFEELKKQGFQVTQHSKGIRVSIHLYNTSDDIHQLLHYLP